jgi:hypothetical protein
MKLCRDCRQEKDQDQEIESLNPVANGGRPHGNDAIAVRPLDRCACRNQPRSVEDSVLLLRSGYPG